MEEASMTITVLLLTGNPAVDLVLNAYTGSKFYQTRDHASLRLPCDVPCGRLGRRSGSQARATHGLEWDDSVLASTALIYGLRNRTGVRRIIALAPCVHISTRQSLGKKTAFESARVVEDPSKIK